MATPFPFRILVIGMTQSGKTYWVRNFLLPVLRHSGYSYVVYDPDEEFTEEDGVIVSKVGHVMPIMRAKKYVIYRPTFEELSDPKERIKAFSQISNSLMLEADAMIKQGGKPKLFFVIDELSTITLADSKRPKNPPQFLALIKRGMKRGIGVCATTQNLKDADTGLISQSQIVVIFDILPVDIVYIESKLPIKIPRQKKKRNGTDAIDIAPYEYFIYNHAHRKLYKDKLQSNGRKKRR